LPTLVRRFDKKPTGFIGIGTAVFGGAGLWLVFGTGLMAPQFMPLFSIQGEPFHLSAIIFGLLQMCFWGGCGLLVPLSISLIADVAAINAKKSGTAPKNATFASINSFSQKCSWTVTGLVIGACIKAVGFIPGGGEQTPEAIKGIANICFLSGPLMLACAGIMLAFYPVTRRTLAQYETVNKD
jgi:GPH family glycoside/pentoside/hexuronide:cation symporter